MRRADWTTRPRRTGHPLRTPGLSCHAAQAAQPARRARRQRPRSAATGPHTHHDNSYHPLASSRSGVCPVATACGSCERSLQLLARTTTTAWERPATGSSPGIGAADTSSATLSGASRANAEVGPSRAAPLSSGLTAPPRTATSCSTRSRRPRSRSSLAQQRRRRRSTGRAGDGSFRLEAAAASPQSWSQAFLRSLSR